jgi:hypothetical protein
LMDAFYKTNSIHGRYFVWQLLITVLNMWILSVPAGLPAFDILVLHFLLISGDSCFRVLFSSITPEYLFWVPCAPVWGPAHARAPRAWFCKGVAHILELATAFAATSTTAKRSFGGGVRRALASLDTLLWPTPSPVPLPQASHWTVPLGHMSLGPDVCSPSSLLLVYLSPT